jgi:O-antigen/teichoic acid export membrane protein
VNIGLNIVMIPRMGMMGAAWATVGGYAVMAALGYQFAHRHYPIPFEWKRIGVVVLAGGLSFAVSLLAPEPSAVSVLIKLGALAVYPAALLGFGFFHEDEIQKLKALLARAPAPADPAPPPSPDRP